MDGRNFLEALPLSMSALSLGRTKGFSANSNAGRADAEDSTLSPGVNYFTRRKMEQLVNTSVPLAGAHVDYPLHIPADFGFHSRKSSIHFQVVSKLCSTDGGGGAAVGNTTGLPR